MRIKLFNKKTMYEFYDLKVDIGKHQSIKNQDLRHAWLVSKDDTLGPRFIDSYVMVNREIKERFFADATEHLRLQTEKDFINHLNDNVGLECLIRKEEVPIEIYEDIKNANRL